jgi:hypothetical protein
MAEPAVPLPASAPKNEPVPWPNAVESVAIAGHSGSPDINGGNSRSTLDGIKLRLSSSVARYSEDIRQGYEEVQLAASRTFSRANRKFRALAEERPMQIVVAVAVASFLAGAALRIWRSNHD